MGSLRGLVVLLAGASTAGAFGRQTAFAPPPMCSGSLVRSSGEAAARGIGGCFPPWGSLPACGAAGHRGRLQAARAPPLMALAEPSPGCARVGRPIPGSARQGGGRGLRAVGPLRAAPRDAELVEEEIKPGKFSISGTKALLDKILKLAAPFWAGEERVSAVMWTAVTFSLALFSTLYAVLISFVQRFFWNALNAKDLPKFNKFLLLYMGVLTIGPPILVLFDWAKSRMSLQWRQALTKRFLGDYLDKKRYYKLPLVSDVDNADQRIAEDIRSFTDKAVSLFCTISVSLCDLVVFSVILYKIYPPLYFTLFLYSTVGTALTLKLGRPLISLNRFQLKKEADFRYDLVRARENAESIAFFNGEKREREEATKRFTTLYANARRMLNFERNLGFFTRWYRYIVQVLPAIVIGPQYFAGKVQLGVISQTFFAFNHVLQDLSIVVNEFSGPQGISSFSAGVDRLDELQQALDRIDRQTALKVDNQIRQVVDPNIDTITFESLHVFTPRSDRKLLRDLTLQVASGERLLVVGKSGIGKSSLMRAVAGLWSSGSGTVTTPPPSATLFMSQKPYMTLGTLRENVLYPIPVSASRASDEEIRAALERVNMGSAPERVGGLDTPVELANIFSLGEQQRLSFARLLLSKPKCVILDESTSALDLDNEMRMYELLKGLGITTISVGNRPSLVAFHDRILRLLGDGEWQLESPRKAE